MPTQLKNGELPEFPIDGPFAGIQSEQPLEDIDGGFADVENMMFRLSTMRVRPVFGTVKQLTPFNGIQTVLPPYLVTAAMLIGIMSDLVGPASLCGTNPELDGQDGGIYEPWIGFYDFFDAGGNRQQIGATTTQLYYNSPSGWIRIGGVWNLNGVPNIRAAFSEVGQQLCFSNGVDPIMLWSPQIWMSPQIAAYNTKTWTPISPPSRYLLEFGNHLLALNTLEGGTQYYQRVHWSGVNDPSDWTSFNSGQDDMNNDLGPINGGVKLGRYAYIFQQLGKVEVQLTGNGTAPFFFQPITSRSKGLAFPLSLAANGEKEAYFVGQDNVYMFDGSTDVPIGDMRIQGRGRIGARSRIFKDIMSAAGTYGSPGQAQNTFGFVSVSINGVPFNAYWLIIPGVAIWIYHIDDMTWTRWTVTGVATCIGNFLTKTVIRAADLVGIADAHNAAPPAPQVLDQTNCLNGGKPWFPDTLTDDNVFTNVILGMAPPVGAEPDNIGNGSVQMFDFSGWSELPWSFITGQMCWGDERHSSTVKKCRLMYKDNGPVKMQVVWTNEEGQSYSNSAQISGPPDSSSPRWIQLPGTGSGSTKKVILPVNLPGEYITLEISGDPGVPFEMTSFAPIYDVGGECR